MIYWAESLKGNLTIQSNEGNSYYSMVEHHPRADVWAHVETSIALATYRLDVKVDGFSALSGGPTVLPAACFGTSF